MPIELKRQLNDRGIVLNPPADITTLLNIDKITYVGMPDPLKTIYLSFDGFESHDERSQIRIWPAQRIVDEKHYIFKNHDRLLVPFADFLVDSEVYFCDFYNNCAPVFKSSNFLDFSIENLNGIDDFVLSVAKGNYNF